MIRLVYSNRTDELVRDLASRVGHQQRTSSPLDPVCIVVPNATVEAYVKRGVSRHCGIAANLEVSQLQRFAADVVARSASLRVADAAVLEGMALTLLMDEAFLAKPALGPARTYLHACGESADAVDVRRVQLAMHVAHLFEEYTYSRPDLVVAWCSGASLSDEETETERWQRHMGSAMFAPGGLARRRAQATLESSVGSESSATRSSRTAPAIVPLAEGVAALKAAAELPPVVHVFGFAHYARSFHDLFQRLGALTEIVVYTISPCEGFWEDSDPADPPLLHQWGRPGREQVRALNAGAGFDHEDHFVDPLSDVPSGATSLLRQLQSDLLRRNVSVVTNEARAAFGGDGSVTVLEHASLRRELEAVASEIWRLVESDESLRFDDIAVLLPESDASAYAAQLPVAFREAHDLPIQTAGVPFAAAGGVAEAVDLLLTLPFGDLTRRQVMGVVSHPAIGKPPGIDAARWDAWSREAGVVRGADRRDYQGTHVEGDLLNWDQGLRRLALGSFMAGDASDVRTPYDLRGDDYVPVEVPASDLADAAAFGRLVRSLLADVQFARDNELTLAAWSRFLRSMIETYVVATGPADERDLAACLRKLHALGDEDLGGGPVRYRMACELARRKMGSSARSQGGSGVVVSTLRAVRGLPFRVVFACGMAEGQFPAPAVDDPLDLRTERRRAGDLTARELDRYAFLELLVSTSDRMVLSYVSRDPLTGQDCPASSVVQELLHALAIGYVDDVDRLRRRHPLRRWDPRYFPSLFARSDEPRASLGTMALPEAEAEARTLALRRDLERNGGQLEPQDVIARSENEPAFRLLARHLGLARLSGASGKLEKRVVISAYEIAKFLEFPLQAWARFRLGLSDRDDEESDAREGEPLETDFRDETVFLRKVLLDAKASERSFAVVYAEMARERELRGEGPSGLFGSAERARHFATLESWNDQLASRGIPDAVQIHRFGPASEHAHADHVHDALAIDVDYVDRTGVLRVVRADIGGRTLPVAIDREESLTWITLTKRVASGSDAWARAGRDRIFLRAFVNEAMMVASGVVPGTAHASLSVAASPDGTQRDDFAPLSRQEATDWLRSTVRDLLTGTHAYCLPCEAVFARHYEDPEGPVTPFIQTAIDKLRQSDGAFALRSAYGPVPRPHLYPPPEERGAKDMIDRRFGLMFAKRTTRGQGAQGAT